MFLLKKFLTVWLMPLPFCLTLLVLGVWLVSFTKRLALGRFLLVCGVMLLLLFSNRWVSTRLVEGIESTFPAIPELAGAGQLPAELKRCGAVVVLGGGNSDNPDVPALSRLSSSSRARLVEGVRLVRQLPAAKLVLTGGSPRNHTSHAAVMEEAAISLGVAPNRIVRIETVRDTEEEAETLSRLWGQEPFALVSSAWHLPRATALMRKRGLEPVPCPCDFTARHGQPERWTDYLWDTESLGRSTWAVYERLGFLWSDLRGKI
jgi:uncharacterized SAM-binding protein YcdF (DUF218 family)